MRNIYIFIFSIFLILSILLVVHIKNNSEIRSILSSYSKDHEYSSIKIIYPQNHTIFPPEIVAPIFKWKDKNLNSDMWLINIKFQNYKKEINFISKHFEWDPSSWQWDNIKNKTIEQDAKITIIGLNHKDKKKILSAGNINIRTSKDPVKDQIFYREVILPLSEAIKNVRLIRMRLGSISSRKRPPVVLTNVPFCINCHAFSRDGKVLGMDIDYLGDKGGYMITDVKKSRVDFSKEKIISWNDYEKDKNITTAALLTQISPDGENFISMVQDMTVFIEKPDIAFSQNTFFTRGILVIYNRKANKFIPLRGANLQNYAQGNAVWSPDGKYIVFARCKAYAHPKKKIEKSNNFPKYDLYRIAFNGGKGGIPESIKGASNNEMSNYFPKYSPDGRWIVFCKARSSILLQPDSNLYIVPSKGGTARKMKCNTMLMNSWHSWSSNSRWLVFSSKANGPYTQLYLTHIDENGQDSPAVLLHNFSSPDRAANIPEFVNLESGALKIINARFPEFEIPLHKKIYFMISRYFYLHRLQFRIINYRGIYHCLRWQAAKARLYFFSNNYRILKHVWHF